MISLKALIASASVALALGLAVPAMDVAAQKKEEPKKEAPKKEERKVKIVSKYEVGKPMTTFTISDRTQSTSVTMQGEVVQEADAQHEELELEEMEVLEVDDDGVPVKIRKRVLYSAERDFELVDEDEMEGEDDGEEVEESWTLQSKNGVSIVATLDKKSGLWKTELESGDKNDSTVKGLLRERKNILDNPMIPEREVTIGEKWDISSDEIKRLIGADQAAADQQVPEFNDIKASCTAKSIGKHEGREYVELVLVCTANVDAQGQSLPFEMTITAWYFIDKSTVENMTMVGEISGNMEPGEGISVALSVKMTAKANVFYEKGDAVKERLTKKGDLPEIVEEEEDESEGF